MTLNAMADIKTTTHFYFHPIIVPTFLLLPTIMTIPLWNLLQVVSTFNGYFFIFIMAAYNLYLTIRIVKYFIQLVKGQPALTLSEKSLFDYQTGQTIDWTDINGLSMGGQRAAKISVKLDNREKYISLYKNPLTKFFYRLNSKLFFGTFNFTVSLLKGSNHNILETLEYYLKSAKEQTNAAKT